MITRKEFQLSASSKANNRAVIGPKTGIQRQAAYDAPSGVDGLPMPRYRPTAADAAQTIVGADFACPQGLHPDVALLYMLRQQVQESHRQFYELLSVVTEQIKGRAYKRGELVDLGLLLRLTEELLEDWRKDCKSRKELAGKLLALEVLQSSASINAPATVEDTVHGKLGYGKPTLTMMTELPKVGTPEYAAYAEHFGVPKDVADGLFKIDWKKAQEVATALAEQGKPQPPGIGKQYPCYGATFVRHRHT